MPPALSYDFSDLFPQTSDEHVRNFTENRDSWKKAIKLQKSGLFISNLKGYIMVISSGNEGVLYPADRAWTIDEIGWIYDELMRLRRTVNDSSNSDLKGNIRRCV